MDFEFATAARIVFAPGASRQLPQITRGFGTRALVVTGRNTERVTPAVKALEHAGIAAEIFPIGGEPSLDAVRQGARVARGSLDVVIGLGGGSAIDAAKAIAALHTNSGEPLDYLEVIGEGRPLEKAPLPFIAVPTTSGTGAEVTRNAVLGSPEHKVKASLRSPLMLAKVALVDPDLTLGLPRDVTVNTGLDALTQVIEPYVCLRANPFTDAFCSEGMKRISASLAKVTRNGDDRMARESMSFASLLGGLALANAGLGVVHGFAAPLGGMLNAPHGGLCAAVLPHGVSVNIRALRERAAESEALKRYREAARILTANAKAEAEDCARFLADICKQLSVPSLRSYGFQREQIPELVEKAGKANSMKSNPIQLRADELAEIAERAF
ncbi:MAG TPA: iron-containing alcohol dehydrogenase [Bryobacteraceae bacterium]|jgi:alcohol dehydrogenase class IV